MKEIERDGHLEATTHSFSHSLTRDVCVVEGGRMLAGPADRLNADETQILKGKREESEKRIAKSQTLSNFVPAGRLCSPCQSQTNFLNQYNQFCKLRNFVPRLRTERRKTEKFSRKKSNLKKRRWSCVRYVQQTLWNNYRQKNNNQTKTVTTINHLVTRTDM